MQSDIFVVYTTLQIFIRFLKAEWMVTNWIWQVSLELNSAVIFLYFSFLEKLVCRNIFKK